jgi:branched-chain amino acid transport system permease protein
MGLNLTAWKLAAFGLSAGLAGLAGALSAVRIGSVSAPSYAFLQSVALAAVAIVMGAEAIGAAVAGGLFLAFGHYVLQQLGIDTQYFAMIVGALLVVQLVFTPQGLVPNLQRIVRRVLRPPGPGSGERRGVAGPVPRAASDAEDHALSEVGS